MFDPFAGLLDRGFTSDPATEVDKIPEVAIEELVLPDDVAQWLEAVGYGIGDLDGGGRKQLITVLVNNWPLPFLKDTDVYGETSGVPNWVDVWLAEGWNTYGNGRWIWSG